MDVTMDVLFRFGITALLVTCFLSAWVSAQDDSGFFGSLWRSLTGSSGGEQKAAPQSVEEKPCDCEDLQAGYEKLMKLYLDLLARVEVLEECVDCGGVPEKGACCRATSASATEASRCVDDQTPEECASLGGALFPGRACSSLAAEECPVLAQPTGSCCHPKISYVNESGVYPVGCLDKLTEYKCGLLQGTWNPTLNCEELGASCAPLGACCYSDAGTDTCATAMTSADCAALGGIFHEEMSCASLDVASCGGSPVDPTGACCHPRISYVNESGVYPVRCLDDLTEYKCGLLQGSWFSGDDCAEISAECAPIGSCCYRMEGAPACENALSEGACLDMEGVFHAGQTCSNLDLDSCAGPVPEEPKGACCHPKISYVNESGVYPVTCLDSLTEYKCTLLQGVWHAEEVCEELGGSCPPIEEEPMTTSTTLQKVSTSLQNLRPVSTTSTPHPMTSVWATTSLAKKYPATTTTFTQIRGP